MVVQQLAVECCVDLLECVVQLDDDNGERPLQFVASTHFRVAD